jgi:hypothetical protein
MISGPVIYMREIAGAIAGGLLGIAIANVYLSIEKLVSKWKRARRTRSGR